jgi:glycine oxidase
VTATTGRVDIVGAGIIGLSIAWRAAQAGLSVTVHDPDLAERTGGASHAAAGMLAPVTEAHYGEEALLALNLASHQRWPAFAAELAEASARPVPLRAEGSLTVAFDDDDLRALDELRVFQEQLGLPVGRLRSRECRELEPMLSPRIRGGIRVDNEANVDNRAVCRALLAAGAANGVCFVCEHADPALLLERDATTTVVVAAGAWSGSLEGLPPEVVPPVRPVKGQIIRLRFDTNDPPLRRNVRALARGWAIYVVPRASGELVVGATVEEKGFDTAVTAGGLRELLEAAIDVLPVVAELEQTEAIAALRPTTPDNAPVLGPTAVDRLVLATGHHRNGVLLAPITADAITQLLLDGTLPTEAAPFTIERFT